MFNFFDVLWRVHLLFWVWINQKFLEWNIIWKQQGKSWSLFFFQDDEIFQIRATPTKKCYKGKAEEITRKLEAQFSINVEAAWLPKINQIYLELAIKSYLTERFVSFSAITSGIISAFG